MSQYSNKNDWFYMIVMQGIFIALMMISWRLSQIVEILQTVYPCPPSHN